LYISPEQTGRMNRAVDYRTDLYSLGIVFYELLTGKMPFVYSDSMKLVHAHIAEIPKTPHIVDSRIPPALSDLILKLISKNADDRYQSAFGLKHDLEAILNNLHDLNKLEKLSIGQNDFSGLITMPDELFGRKNELEQLTGAFERISHGSSELMLITGKPGVGKTALIQEYSRLIERNRGIFVDGKFDPLQMNVPYFALIKAFSNFVNFVLTQKDEELEYWRSLIQKTVGNVGKVLTNVLPGLKLIIGEQADIPELEGKEAQNRFNYAWTSIIKAICSPKHPLVLFIDDVHWADSASLELLKTILLDFEINYFLCLVAYPHNEIDNTHALSIFIEELENKEAQVGKIKLENLQKEDITDLTFNMLNLSGKSFTDVFLRDNSMGTEILAGEIYSKTKGNVFFSIQLLITLFEEGQIFHLQKCPCFVQ